MREWSYFFPDVLPSVLGCPEPTVERHLLRAAQDFFKRTKAWVVTMDPITTIADQDTYDLNRPLQTELVKVTAAILNGNDIELDAAQSTTLADRLRNSSGSNRIRIEAGRRVVVLPMPAAGLPLIIEGIFKPSDKAIGISSDEMAEQFSEALGYRALATLKTEDRRDPWYDPASAQVKGGLYEKLVGQTAKDAWRAWSVRNPRSRGVFF